MSAFAVALRRFLIVAAATSGLVAFAALPALAQIDINVTEDRSQVVMTGEVVVSADETSGTVVIFDGPVRVQGTVDGDVVAFNGDVTVSGTVTGSVTAFNGVVRLSHTAVVQGDLVTQKAPLVAPGATIGGERRRVNTDLILGRIAWISAVAIWIAVTVSTFILGALIVLLMPKAAERSATVGLTRIGPTVGWGFLMTFGLPLVAVVLAITLIGIPLGLALLFALGLIYLAGYTAAAFVVGRAIVKPPTNLFLAFLVGWGILRAVSIVPFLAPLVSFAAIVYGLGALTVAAWRAGRQTEAPALPPPPVPTLPEPA